MKVSQTIKQWLTGFLIRVSAWLFTLFVLSGLSECPGGGAREAPRLRKSEFGLYLQFCPVRVRRGSARGLHSQVTQYTFRPTSGLTLTAPTATLSVYKRQQGASVKNNVVRFQSQILTWRPKLWTCWDILSNYSWEMHWNTRMWKLYIVCLQCHILFQFPVKFGL